MTRTKQDRFVEMIFSKIADHGECALSNKSLETIFGSRTHGLKPLSDSYQENLDAFCNEHGLEILPESYPGRTVFGLATEGDSK